MKKKIFYLFSFFLILQTSIYANIYYLIKKTRNRPDLFVNRMYEQVSLWIDDPFATVTLSESLYKLGRYRHSLIFGLSLSFSELSPKLLSRNYFIIAQNYSALKNIEKTRLYLDKALDHPKQYYYFYYARFEEFEKNYPKSILLYEKALNKPFSDKDYIIKAYSRVLLSALLHYKNKDSVIFGEILKKILLNPKIDSTKAIIIKKSLKL